MACIWHGAWSLGFGLGGNWEEVWAHDMPLVTNEWSFIAATFDKECRYDEAVSERGGSSFQESI